MGKQIFRLRLQGVTWKEPSNGCDHVKPKQKVFRGREKLRKRGSVPPSLKGSRLFGIFPQFWADPLTTLQDAASHGDVVALSMMPVIRWRVYLINHPDYIRHIFAVNHRNYNKGWLRGLKPLLGDGLLTSEDELHTRQRRLIQPAFHHERLADYGRPIVDLTYRQVSSWEPGKTLDIHHEMTLLTMKIVAKCLYGVDMNGDLEKIAEATEALISKYSVLLWAAAFHVLTGPLAGLLRRLHLFKASWFIASNRGNLQLIDRAIRSIISERKANCEDKTDLLSMLLNSLKARNDEGMSSELVRDEVMTLFLAGHETIASALAWTFYALSQHPEAETKLHAELDTILGGRMPTTEDLPQLKYTHMVLSESMRLYPPVWAIDRYAVAEDLVGGYTIPAKSFVMISPYVIHRDPKYWDNPEKFHPERFNSEAKNTMKRHVFIPFADGPRGCVGEHFAWTAGKLLMAIIAQRYRLKLAPNSVIKPEPSITMRPKHGLPMVIVKRDS